MRLSKITKQAAKFVETLPPKQYKQVCSKFLSLLSDPFPQDCSPLKGAKSGEHRVDVGEYRIIYSVVDDDLDLLVIGKRNGDEAYEIWERQRGY